MKYLSKITAALVIGATTALSILPATNVSADTTPITSMKNATQNGWIQDSQGYWYYYVNGVKQTGWIHPDSWYYLDSNGVMQIGWKKIDGKWYYFNEKGAMQTDWFQDTSGKWYYSNTDGVMQTGWIESKGKWYYLDTNGAMKTNAWIQSESDSHKYFYVKDSGEMAVSEPVDNNQYYVDGEGAWYDNWQVQKVLDMACRQLGKSYVYGATGPDTFDCSGLTQYCYKQALGIDISRTTYTQLEHGTVVSSQSALKPGDLVFPHTGHVGIYLGNGQMIHAPQTGDVVKISSVYKFYTGRRIL